MEIFHVAKLGLRYHLITFLEFCNFYSYSYYQRKELQASTEPGVGELAVGSRVVWCLSQSNQLYRLRGLSLSNPAGDYWKAVPKKLKAISVDSNDHLWGIDLEDRLVYHKVCFNFCF